MSRVAQSLRQVSSLSPVLTHTHTLDGSHQLKVKGRTWGWELGLRLAHTQAQARAGHLGARLSQLSQPGTQGTLSRRLRGLEELTWGPS